MVLLFSPMLKWRSDTDPYFSRRCKRKWNVPGSISNESRRSKFPRTTTLPARAKWNTVYFYVFSSFSSNNIILSIVLWSYLIAIFIIIHPIFIRTIVLIFLGLSQLFGRSSLRPSAGACQDFLRNSLIRRMFLSDILFPWTITLEMLFLRLLRP